MSPRVWIFIGALSAAIGVGLGAYHAHGLEPMLERRGSSPEEIDRQMHSFDVGVRYEMYHALGLILVGLLSEQGAKRCLSASGLLFVAGTLLFSGCLYIPVLSGMKLPWYLVPSGGAAFIAGWIVLCIGALISKRST
jgi:uncharacterized membrane protein YgdD (TMEM256/DUF423 family)